MKNQVNFFASTYVKIQDDVRRSAMESSLSTMTMGEGGGDDQAVIRIFVRQLEALIRLTESLLLKLRGRKMRKGKILRKP